MCSLFFLFFVPFLNGFGAEFGSFSFKPGIVISLRIWNSLFYIIGKLPISFTRGNKHFCYKSRAVQTILYGMTKLVIFGAFRSIFTYK